MSCRVPGVEIDTVVNHAADMPRHVVIIRFVPPSARAVVNSLFARLLGALPVVVEFMRTSDYSVENYGSLLYKESCNNKPIYGYVLPNLSLSPNLYKVQSVYNSNVAS